MARVKMQMVKVKSVKPDMVAPLGAIQTFATGATRSADADKFDYEGFENPMVVRRFAQFMHKHRIQADGNLRDSDNWQKGITQKSYMKSAHRHFMDLWSYHRGVIQLTDEELEDACCALSFNVRGYLFEFLKGFRPDGQTDETIQTEELAGVAKEPKKFSLSDLLNNMGPAEIEVFMKEYLVAGGYKVTKAKSKKRRR